MLFSFVKVCEMDTQVVVFETRAKDLHDATRKLLENKAYDDYDVIYVNGEMCY